MRHDRVRAQARRRQILQAAEACFRARGIHAATVAEIAAAASLSVGQIYRFFESKEAIVEAIAKQQMKELLAVVAAVSSREDAAGAVRRLLARAFDRLCEPGAAALFIEVTAEASRNPRAAAIVHERDREIRDAISALLAKTQRLDIADQSGCPVSSEMVCLALEGVATRLIRNPELDRRTLDELQDRLLAKLLGERETARGAHVEAR